MSVWGVPERLHPDEIVPGDRAGQQSMDIHRGRYLDVVPHVVGRRVLDFASGAGYGTRLLADAGADMVVGVDYSHDAVARAQAEFGGSATHFVVGDANHHCVRGPFDIVVSFETVEHLPDPRAFLLALREALAPGGLCFVSAPLGETRHIDQFHQQAFDVASLVDLVESVGLEVERTRVDPWRISFADLLRWRRQYPDLRPSWGELVGTRRGRWLFGDALRHGGIRIDELLVVARLAG